MAKASTLNFDVSTYLEHAVSQFRGLNPNEPGQWPSLPKAAASLAMVLAMVVAGWFALLSSATDELQRERDLEPTFKADYRNKLGQAVNLNELRKQKLQVQEYVTQLEKQLPGKAEMDALSRTTTPSCRLPFASAAATTTSAHSQLTLPTCRASSPCRT